MSDDQYHEIHLGGKQLVFLFIAAMAVVVVSFLSGVMVGRGVQEPAVDEAPVAQVAHTASDLPLDVAPDAGIGGGAMSAGDPVASGERSGDENLSYYERLTSATPVPETLTPEPDRRTAPPSPSPPPPPPSSSEQQRSAEASSAPRDEPSRVANPPAAPAPVPVRAAAVSGEPSGEGYAVQVTSLTSRTDAETVARNLASKGYPSFVQSTADGRFRVRVGKYTDRAQAEQIARRLEREEKFKGPWVDR